MVSSRRTFLPFIILAFAFAVVGIRLFFVQVWHHEELKQCVQKMVCRERPETPCRGMIMDKWGRILAMSVLQYGMFVDPTRIVNARQIETNLKRVNLNVPATMISAAGKTQYLPVAKDLDTQTVQKIKVMGLKGVGFTSHYDRQYPEGRLACHLLGVVGKDGAGLEGVELLENEYLTGVKIQQRKYRDGRGREIAEKMIAPDALRGADIYLTIDRNLQFIAEQEIEKAWAESHARRAMAVIQDPNTGEILAMAVRPNYDPASFSGGGSLRNPAVADIFEPGSTFKLVTVAAGLEENIVKPDDTIWCENGKYAVAGHTIKDHEKKGTITVRQIMECSSNIGTAKIGQKLGRDKLYEYVRQFGFSSLSGVDLPGEARGLLKDPENWSALSVPIISFGQEIGATALQVINAYSAIANGGMLLEPRVVKEIKSSSGETVYVSEKRAIRRVVSEKTAATMREILTGVVEQGTGQMAKVQGYSVGGKTGTAQKRDPVTKRYSATNYVASFCGIIPATGPRLTIFVVLDEPQGSDYWGSSRAAPVFSRIATRSAHYLQIPPDRQPLQVCNVQLCQAQTNEGGRK
jgi:cell division protein FtsI (penicillin-binding protein 3)